MFKRLTSDKNLKRVLFSKNQLILFMALFSVVGGYAVYSSLAAGPQSCSSVNQYGITFSFDKSYSCGQYANGDWWVLGPTTITAISPAFDGSNNGWEVNPVVSGSQGFDADCNGNQFSASLVPALPYIAQAGQSIVKSLNSGVSGRGCLQTAAVLTVVGAVPPGNGADVFRPPYVGTDKSTIAVSELQTNLLPSLAPVANAPSLATIEAEFSRVWLDHKGGQTGRALHPLDNMEDYGADIGTDIHEGALRLMLNDPLANKMPALIRYVQTGIDQYYMFSIGQTWPDGDGHRPGHRLILAFAATMLNKPDWKAALNSTTALHEDRMVISQTFQGKWLWGNQPNETSYWNTVDTDTGYRARVDPYLYVDGGTAAGDPYLLCCNAQPWKGEILATYIMPSLQGAWNPTEWSQTANVIDRFVTQGTLASPDPCAPRSQGGGPNGSGGCVLDPDLAFYSSPTDFGCKTGLQCGRFPAFAGANIDGGLRYSTFAREMWNAYRNSSTANLPTVSLSASPTSVTSGSASTLTWSSTNASSCTASGSWTGSKATSGSQSTGNLTATSTYTLTCSGTGGSANTSATVTVNLPPPSPGDPATDNFERATLGSNWQLNLGSGGIINNSDLGILSGSISINSWVGSTFSNNQFSQGQISTNASSEMQKQVFVRRRISDSARYAFHYNIESSPLRWEIKYDGVPTAQTKLLATNSTAPAPVLGDTLRIEVEGDNLRGYHNGNLVLSATDSSAEKITSGPPGLTFRLIGNANVSQPEPVFESWSGGSISGPPADTTPPTVSVTSPANGSTVCGSINLTASASDNIGVVGVQFRVGGTNFGAEDTTAPYSIPLDTATMSNGSHSLAAVTRDAAGNQTTSATLMVTFNNPCSPTQKQGDLNNDGTCNIIDLSILLSNYGKTATPAQGDINNDGSVNIIDLSILLSKYGT